MCEVIAFSKFEVFRQQKSFQPTVVQVNLEAQTTKLKLKLTPMHPLKKKKKCLKIAAHKTNAIIVVVKI